MLHTTEFHQTTLSGAYGGTNSKHSHREQEVLPSPVHQPFTLRIDSANVEVPRQLFSISAEAKVWGIAAKALTKAEPPSFYPEYTNPTGTSYVYRDFKFWTSGFFPGSLYQLLERRKGNRRACGYPAPKPHDAQIEFACRWWTINLHQNSTLLGSHDLGFMTMPWARPAWEMNQDQAALDTLRITADTLLARFNSTVGAIRSWDTCQTKKYKFTDVNNDFLMIIDNMMNLDLLFYVSKQTGDHKMQQAAVQHAYTTAKSHIREDGSTIHLVNFDPSTGSIKERLTNQGFSSKSCWARGQAWAIAGFAETYHWTQDDAFLDISRRCADYFLARLPTAGVAPWDFDASQMSGTTDKQPPDTSATMIAAYGLLLIHRALIAKGQTSQYLEDALRLAKAVCDEHLNPPATYNSLLGDEPVNTVEQGTTADSLTVGVNIGRGDTILNGATINNYEFAPRRWADHGLVYADYYFLVFGNELLRMSADSENVAESF